MTMRRLLAFAILAVVGGSLPALASEHTSVMSSADPGDPFDGSLALRWDWLRQTSLISREFLCNNVPGICPGTSRIARARELTSQRDSNTLSIDARIGLYHDFEAFMVLPFGLGDRTDLDYAPGVSAANSTVAPATGASFFSVPNTGRFRHGFGDMTVGLRFAPLAQWRQPAYPTLRLEAAWTIPTGDVRRAGNDAIGTGLHTLHLEVMGSHRIAFAEPYGGVFGNLRFPGSSTLFQQYADTQGHVGPGHEVGVTFGTEFYPWRKDRADGKADRYVAIDVGFSAMYTFQGREYTELSDAFGNSACNDSSTPCIGPHGKNLTSYDRTLDGLPQAISAMNGITDVGAYGTFSVWTGVTAQPLPYLKLSARFLYARVTAHWLTMADVGKDSDNPPNGVNLVNGQGKNEYNPVYNSDVDAPGDRFRSEGMNVYGVMLMVTGQY